jgi:hypothetical protein
MMRPLSSADSESPRSERATAAALNFLEAELLDSPLDSFRFSVVGSLDQRSDQRWPDRPHFRQTPSFWR